MAEQATDARRVPPLPVAVAPAAVLSVAGGLLSHGGHLASYVVQFAVLTGGFWLADRAVRFSAPLWWAGVGIISANLFMGAVDVHGVEIYDLQPGAHVTRLDHPMHFVSAAVVTWGAWEALGRVVADAARQRLLVVVVAGLAALGLGAIKEMSDAITGWDTDPAEVAWSTRWDLIFNTLGAGVAMAVIVVRMRRRTRGDDDVVLRT